LTGLWIEKVTWIQEDSFWVGYKSLDLIQIYSFKDNRFYRKVFNSDSVLLSENRGEYRINDKNTKIRFYTNTKKDSMFKQGDTVLMDENKVHLLNDSILRIEQFYMYEAGSKKEIGEYKRMTNRP
jgi:hypothetical protein